MHLSIYGLVVGSYLLIKLALSIVARKGTDYHGWTAGRMSVATIITAHNESPTMLVKCLASIMNQTRKPDSVIVVDDASAVPVRILPSLYAAFDDAGIELLLYRFEENQGKREGLAVGFEYFSTADVYLCVDSDTVLDEDAVRLGIRHFNDNRVNVVTGLVLAHNRAKNLLTRFIDMRYANAMLGDRVAYSRFGSVLCACGSLAFYRGTVVRQYLDDFLGQTFLGRPCTFGDDRRLTYYCLREGRSVIEPRAVALTDVPERLGHLVRQQARWTKSFVRESVLLLRQRRLMNRTFYWLAAVEAITWTAFTAALLVVTTFAVVRRGETPETYLIAVVAATWLRSVHYLRRASRAPLWDRLLTVAVSPLFTLLNLVLLVPLRVYALATLKDGRWGTRANGPEIAEEPA